MKRFSAVIAEADLEDVLDVLLPLIPAGVHERPAGAGRIELSWYGERSPQPPGLEVSCEAVPGDRAERRRRFGAIWIVADRFAIRASGAPPAPEGLEEIVVDADRGQFGTGAHPTTHDCLELLLHVAPGGALADLGCGAGVLAIAAARLGFAPVTAVDFEPGSVRGARENALRNGVEVACVLADLLEAAPPPAATVLANLPLAVHRAVAGRLGDEVRTVIASGIVSAEADAAVAAYGLRPRLRKDSFGWATILLERA